MLPNRNRSFGYYSQPPPIDNEPSFFSLQDLRDEDDQSSPLLKLSDEILESIMEYVPLKDRLLRVRPVCRKLSSAVKRSVKSVEFLRDELDYCDDAKIAFFLALYGKDVEHMNFDLFRSCSLREYTQWSWRQSVISSVTKCTSLKQLDILICCRHRLRDGDLQVIFKHCQNLEVLRMDASFVNGNCFVKAPVSLRKLELECCQTFNKQGFLSMCFRLFKLETLHVSLLTCLDEQVIKRIGDMKNLRNVSIVADPDTHMAPFRLAEIRRLPRLTTLCLDGVPMVTDKFLGDLSDNVASQASKKLEHLSLAFCRNISANGIAKLKALTNLKSLNLDGVSKRDISAGVETVGSEGRLERLFIAEDANCGPRAVIEVVTKCESLRTLDISSNHRLTHKGFAETVYNARAFTFAKPLKILTDIKSMWSRHPPHQDAGRVELIYIGPPNDEFVDSISNHTAQQLPRGYLIPDLRRGNRFKMLDPNLNMSAEQLEPETATPSPDLHDQENMPPVSEVVPLVPNGSESFNNFQNFEALLEQQDQEFAKILLGMQQTQVIQNTALLGFDQMILPNNDLNFTPNLFSSTDFENSITVGTAGAPGPPTDKKSEVILKHCRPSRPKRQAQKEKAQLRRSSGANANAVVVVSPIPTGPSFTDDDFPPL